MATTTAASIATSSTSDSMSLLERTKALIQAERSLTATIEKVEPWMASNVYHKSSIHRATIVRPIPRTMDEVHKVLAVGRNFASRTSAPAGWNPAAPLVGFSTPNPLPHQLRGGTMAALQLERAKQSESDKKRKRQLEEEEKQEAAAKKQAEEAAQSRTEQANKEYNERKQQQQKQQQQQHARRVAMNQAQPATDANMNLSDSSSSEEESSEDD
ncbi:unnamed protein product [Cylindrotheca closterium]|uniref:Mediator of RNA polymerase II transcription subunit 4 n=1 Tax=Cylindrotheca closterium TaxID=2856 RepID=A0AAD2JGW2_9STRA|nr:unnamed protein product [Cylindrotheca closterium]